MEYLLKDRHFFLQTDHDNLTRVYSTGSAKVLRWKMRMQEYNYTISHLEGLKNEIADAFSRLCAIDDDGTNYLSALDEDRTAADYCFACPSPSDNMLNAFSNEDLNNIETDFTFKRIPQNIYEILGKVHNSVSGHHGQEKTLKKLFRQKIEFPHMREHIRNFIRQCPCCQKMATLKVAINTTPFTTACYAPMDTLNIDTLGPFPMDSRGNCYIVAVIDKFTRFVELYAQPTTDAMGAADAVLQHLGTYGAPNKIQTDNGSQYVNELIKELSELTGVDHSTTMAYSKEENAIIERSLKEVQRHLRALVFEVGSTSNWSRYLPLIKRILNSTVHDSIGVAPATLVYGNSINLDRGIFLPNEASNTTHQLSEWSQSMLNTQKKLIEISSLRQFNLDQHNKLARLNTKELITQFSPNDYVLVEYPKTAIGKKPPHKLNLLLKGPMRVLSNTGPHYKLINLANNEEESNVHVKRLSPFLYDPSRIVPKSIAQKDYGEIEVEAIVKHVGDEKKKSTLDFLVKWKNQSDSYNLWLPWSQLRNNSILHEYLRSKNLARLIPKFTAAIATLKNKKRKKRKQSSKV